ncbi:MAG TPA: NAD(P)H-quinone oxidoreductase [Kofleriaceae bacterium]|nr:NAD(P)H-quinone oxidoreductase [Kofleriaceae bacterium]
MAAVAAIRYRGAGGAEVIELGEIEVREPGVGEVTVEVAAAGLNRADVLQRRGQYPAPPGSPPDVPGLELAGTVIARGPGATLFEIGAPVMAIVGGGAMAQRITLHERELAPVPRGVDVVAAAAIPEAFLTAWDALVSQARLGGGETMLVHAAASGVGTAALQIARAVGARAIATTRTAAKLPPLAAFGLADGDGLVVTDGTFAPAVQKLTGGGASVILDAVGAAYFDENLRALAPRGRLVLIGTLGGGGGKPPAIGMMLGKRATVIGTVMRARPLEEKIALARIATTRLVPLFERGVLAPVIDQIMPMTACADAHARMERDANVGKIVLRW